MISLPRIAPVVLGLIIFGAAITPACAQQEFSSPQGKGRVVVVVSGHDGAAAYRGFAAQIAQLGYDAVLFDANNLAETRARRCGPPSSRPSGCRTRSPARSVWSASRKAGAKC